MSFSAARVLTLINRNCLRNALKLQLPRLRNVAERSFSICKPKQTFLSLALRQAVDMRNKSDKCDGEKGGKKNGKKDNLTAVLYGIEDLRLEQRPIPKVNAGEVLLAMDCVGICGSDVHYLVHGKIGNFVVKKPMIIGHEASGIVTEVGKGVTHLKKGDRVAIEPGVPCRICDFCKEGRYNLCPGMKFCATPPYDGNLTRYYKQAADFCYKLPDHLTMEEGALLEPLSVGVAACRRGNVKLGMNLLIMGSGPIGLVTYLVARSLGATNIVVTDMNEARLAVAEELGAKTLQICKDAKVEDIVKQVEEGMGTRPNISIDCVGSADTAKLGILATRSGGVCVLVGMAGGELALPMMDALSREVDIRGVFRYCNDYKPALALAASGRVNIKRLVTHHFDIEETADAFETSRCGTDGAIKVMIHVQERDKNNEKPFDDDC